MPIEVTPPPFANQQLPYTPKFVRQEIEGLPGSSQSIISRGPASAAASAIIPPQPGGISSPHRAIPALPDAGYTSATLHAPSMVGSLMPYPPSMAHLPIHSASSSLHNDGWMSASLPAPRSSRRASLVPVMTANIAPVCHHRSPSHSAIDDGASDASYYARPKTLRRHRSDHVDIDSGSDGSSPHEHEHRRAISHSHQHPRHRSPSIGPPADAQSHSCSPNAPSPLSLVRSGHLGSPLSPSYHRQLEEDAERRSPRHSYLVEDDHRSRHDQHVAKPHQRHRHHSINLTPRSAVADRVHVQGDVHRRRHHSHHHSMIPPPQNSRRSPSPAPVESQSPYHRTRAVSMHALSTTDDLSPGVAAAFGGLNMGVGGTMYQSPSVVGGQDSYDDGSSIAGSALTFLDGQVDGRTSQYGLPKYPKEMKPDYRRFCVQRGKADVYLD